MKNFLLAIVLLVFTFIQGNGQNLSDLSKSRENYGWETISEVTGGLNVIYFIDSTKGWIIGNEGKILATEDGGTSWSPQNSGTTNKLTSIYFINNKIGFACGYNRTLIYTNDKGNTWSPIQIDSSVNSIYSSLGTNPDNNLYFISNYGEIYFSSDSGKTWSNIYNFNELGFSYVDYSNYPICFAKLYGFGVLYKSTDGGNIWNKLILPTQFTGDHYFLNSNVGWITEDWAPSSSFHDSASIYITTDGCKTWTRQSTLEGISVNNIVFVDSLEGWASSHTPWQFKIHYTTDSGQSWTCQFEFETDSLGVINDIFFLNNRNGWALTSKGKIIKYGESTEVSVNKPDNTLPNKCIVYQNYPNPFNNSTKLSMNIPSDSDIKICIYNLLGQKIKDIINAKLSSGYHSFEWDGKDNNGADLPSGIYFITLKADQFVNTIKTVLLK